MIVTPYSFSILVTFSNIGPFKTPKNYFGRKCSPLPSHVIPNSTELYEDYEISASQQYRRTPFTNSTAKSGVRTTRNQGNDLFRHSDGLIHTTRATLPPLPSDTRKRWIVVHVRKKYACIIGCETILARVESRFTTCQLFQSKEKLLLLELELSFFV